MRKFLLKSIAFLACLALVLTGFQSVFEFKDNRIYQCFSAFYREPRGSLDAIYIGASNVYSYWSSPFGWGEFGISVFPLSTPSMPAQAMIYMVEEAMKTQPDALYILCLNDFKYVDDVTASSFHFVSDYLKLSPTKIALINDLVDECEEEVSPWEYYFPFIRFHSRWNELVTNDFVRKVNGVKGGSWYDIFLHQYTDVTSTFHYTDASLPLYDRQQEELNQLLDYCEASGGRFLFLFVPQAVSNESAIGQLNTVADICRDRGFDVLDLMNSVDEIGLQLECDYYNGYHVNLHGSIKYTRYLGQYLTERYGFKDKRGNPAYSSWDAAYEKYLDIVGPHIAPMERDNAPWDPSLSGVRITSCVSYGTTVRIDWEPVEGAQGYAILRKAEDPRSSIDLIGTVPGDMDYYQDLSLPENSTFSYAVVAAVEKEGATCFGQILYPMKSATTTLDTPDLLFLEEWDGAVTISWKAVSGVDGYKIYKAINGDVWLPIADISADSGVLSFRDTVVQPDLPYRYSVSSTKEIDGETVVSYYNPDGLLRFRDIPAPSPSVKEETDGSRRVFWGHVKGANYYRVYRLSDSGAWDLIRDKRSADYYVDADPLTGPVTYRVVSVIEYGGTVYEYPSDPVTSSGKED